MKMTVKIFLPCNPLPILWSFVAQCSRCQLSLSREVLNLLKDMKVDETHGSSQEP